MEAARAPAVLGAALVAGAAALAAALSSSPPPAGDLVVALASKGGPKLAALQGALRRLAANDAHWRRWRCVPTLAPSSIAEQPHGYEETRRGAENRLSACRRILQPVDGAKPPSDWLVAARRALARHLRDGEEHLPAAGFIVSVENGLVEFAAGEWYDFAWVIVEEVSTGRQATSLSAGLRFPRRYCDAAALAGGGFAQHTAGSFVASALGSDGQDPHRALTGGAVTRAGLLEQAMLACFGELRLPPT